MDKKRTAVITVTFFLVQAVFISALAQAEVYSSGPLTEIRVDRSNVLFRETCNIICMALSLYRADAFLKMPKEELIKMYSGVLLDSRIRFDFEHLDMIKKGWTRYYPFSAGEKSFVARLFLTKESYFQPKVPVISELVVENIGVTLQILPNINEILNDCKIKPSNVYKPSLVDSSA